MEQTSIHGNKTIITTFVVLLILVSGITFTSFGQLARQELKLSIHKNEVCQTQLEETNQREIAGDVCGFLE